MKKLGIIAVFFAATVASAQVTYWFRGWQRQPSAQYAQEYFMLEGTNIVFTYTNNHVVINSSGGGTNSGPAGPPGPAGADGTNGINGTNGLSATIAVGDMYTNAAGTQGGVTNRGTPSAAIFDFTLPVGPTGPQGPVGPAGPPGNGTNLGLVSFQGRTNTQALLTEADVLGVLTFTPATNGGPIAGSQVTGATTVTNGLATTNWVGAGYYPLANPSGYVTSSVTNGYPWTNVSYIQAQGITNGWPWTNVSYTQARGITNGWPWTNLTVAHAAAVTNGYPWTNTSFAQATQYVGANYLLTSLAPTTNTLATTNYAVTAATNAAFKATNGWPWISITGGNVYTVSNNVFTGSSNTFNGDVSINGNLNVNSTNPTTVVSNLFINGWTVMATNAMPNPTNGMAGWWNSNGVVYLLTSVPGQTTWAATNKIAP